MRRATAPALATVVALSLVLACGPPRQEGMRVIVLGFDGMDYALTRQLMDEGRMPNFSRLEQTGSFAPLGTAVPPQSPVAWSNFITGMDSGGHGIYDFLHRDPQTMIPYFSTSQARGKSFTLGKYQVPYSGGYDLLRKGEAFWEVLERQGVETTIIRMPANFPPSGTATRELSGMGTVDILGTYGTFTFFTSELFAFAGEDIAGGEIVELDVYDNVVEAQLLGPENPFLVESELLTTPFTVYLDPEEDVAKLVVGTQERVLQVGEWSDWVEVEFDMIPTQSLHGICRFYLRQVRPEFELYVTPINFDPLRQDLPISTPEGYATELARATGRFFTQGMPEDTQAGKQGVLSMEEFYAQSRLAGQETIRQYHYVLDHFEDGLLFYYFGNVDQTGHVLWHTLDPEHPQYDPERDAPLADVIPRLYQELDEIVGYTLENMGEDTTLIVMSDHGFTSWRRSFHLNTWLREEGYLAVKDPDLFEDPGLFLNVDWSRTRAYGLGLNGLYLNQRGRERQGITDPAQRQELLREISHKLLATLDPKTGEPAVTRTYIREEVYRDRGEIELGPDLLVGYAKGTRGSGKSSLGELTEEVMTDNTSDWTGDHCMDHEAVPGVLATNRKLKKAAPRLQDLAPAILAEFGIEGFPKRATPEDP